MDTEVFLGIVGGVICGAVLVGGMVIGFIWWQSRQKIQMLRENLNRNPTLMDSYGVPPVPPPGFPVPGTPYNSADAPQAAEPSPPPPPPTNNQPAPPPPPPDPARLSESGEKEQKGIPSPSPSSPHPEPAPGSTWLEGVGGVANGQRIIIHKEETVLGRSGVCDVQFHDPKVSRQHSMLRLYNSEYWIQDMKSSRGTIVNGNRIENHRLHDSDQIKLGDTILVFRRN